MHEYMYAVWGCFYVHHLNMKAIRITFWKFAIRSDEETTQCGWLTVSVEIFLYRVIEVRLF